MITHWTRARKMEVIREFRGGATDVQIFEYYGVTRQELEEWIAKVERHGSGALRVTHETRYRRRLVPSNPPKSLPPVTSA
jgi:Protein of unknown function (DUF1153)